MNKNTGLSLTINLFRSRLNNRAVQRGLSLVELMVAMLLGLILLAVMLQLFVGNRLGLQLTHDLTLTQQSARVTMNVMAKSIRAADAWGYAEDATKVKDGIQSPALSSLPGGCNQNWVFKVEEGLHGYEGAANLGATGLTNNQYACLGSTEYVPNSDILVVRFADQTQLKATSLLNTPPFKKSYFLREQLTVDMPVTLTSGEKIFADFMPEAINLTRVTYNMPYQFEVYFVRPCAFLNTSGACADQIPSLIRVRLVEDKLVEELLMQGVAQLQFEYGLDSVAPDNQIDQFASASGVADWSKAQLVRMALLTRSLQADRQIDETLKPPYTLVGDLPSYTVPAADKNFRHQVFLQDVTVRNRALR